MKASTLISLVFSISLVCGCSSAPTKSLLEERAGYGFNAPGMQGMTMDGVRYAPTRVPEKVIVAWLHAKELPSKDYFWGSWISVVVAPEGWEMVKVETSKGEKPKVKNVEARPSGKRPARTKAGA